MQEYEKRGAFYLGKAFDPSKGTGNGNLLLYDAKELITHAMIVGMTGSGKTGLAITRLEKAADVVRTSEASRARHDPRPVTPRKSGISVGLVALCRTPGRQAADRTFEPV